MSKKKIMAGLFCTSMLGAMLVGPSVSFAAPSPESGDSTGSVKFKSGDIGGGSTIGVIEVPTEFNFTETSVPSTVPTNETVIDLDPSIESVPGANPATKRVVVADVRGERKAGWKLTGKISTELTYTPSGGGASKTLTGSEIRMSQGLNYLPDAPNDLDQMLPEASLTPDMTQHAPDQVTSNVVITNADSPVMLASGETSTGAQDGRGEGYWAGEFTNIKLAVPSSPMKNVLKGEQYNGVVTWTLTDSAT